MKCCQALWEEKALHFLVAKSSLYIRSVFLSPPPVLLYTFRCAYCPFLQKESSTLCVTDFDQIPHYWLHIGPGWIGERFECGLGTQSSSEQSCLKEGSFRFSPVQVWEQGKQCLLSFAFHPCVSQSYLSSKKDRKAKTHFSNWKGQVKHRLHEKHLASKGRPLGSISFRE